MDDLPAPRLLRQPIRIKALRGEPPSPPPLVADGLMHPYSVTTLYGAGGIGKGFVACYAYRALVEEGYKPLILDFEGVEYEWHTRLYGMGLDDISYYEAPGRLSLNLAAEISAAIFENGITHVILDSASAARGEPKDNDSGGGDATVNMFRAMKSMRVPVLLIAHEGKRGNGPIGSVHFQTQSRLMWRAEAVANGTELRMTKANDRALQDKPLTFVRVITQHGIDVARDYPGIVHAKPQEVSIPTYILRILRERNRRMSVTEVHEIIVQEGVEVSFATVNTAMSKLLGKGKLERPERGKYAIPIDQVNLPTTQPT